MPSETQKQKMRDLLYGFEKHGVPRIHLECLMWFYENENKIVDNETLRGKQIEGKSKKGYPFSARRPIPPNDIVHNHHYLHTGVRGWYKPKGEKIIRYDEQKREPVWEGQDTFVQSLQTGTGESLEGYGKEIELDENSNWDRINYNHNSKNNYYEITGGYIDRCYGHKLPIGIIFKQESGKNKILGLGWITNVSEDKLDYIIEPYPASINRMNSQFQFVKKDFELTGSTIRDDALYRSSRFQKLRKELVQKLSSNFDEFRSRVGAPGHRAQPITSPYKPYTWMGFWKGENKFDEFQFQISLTNWGKEGEKNPPELSAGLWFEGLSKSKKLRIKMIEQFKNQKNEFFHSLKQLPSEYALQYGHNDTNSQRLKISELSENDVELLIQKLEQSKVGSENTKFKIGRFYTEKESIDLKTNASHELSVVFENLIPLNKFLSGEVATIKLDSDTTLDEIADVILEGPPEIAVGRDIVLRILRHLESGKNVILVGAPGVGKTMLSKRILEIYGHHRTGNEYLRSVATPDWSRYHVIGGINLQQEWHSGVVSKAAEEERWLLIDEFNRADINKAFGEMFLAIEDGNIPLTDEEQEMAGKETIKIPDEFRMIGTMNDYDKNLLLTELSYGLITRFAFIDIEPDQNKEKESVKNQIIDSGLEIEEEDWNLCNDEIQKFFEFTKEVRKWRMIGVRTTVDVIRYMVYASKTIDDTNKEKLDYLDEALCDYLLPQFDRLDKKTIEETENASQRMGAKRFTEKLTQMRKDLEGMSNFLS